MYLGIEIGGTKLQIGLGKGDGVIQHLWREQVEPALGGEGIRQQILLGLPQILTTAQLDMRSIQGAGIGFGGPTDDVTQSVIKSHHIHGWDRFPLAQWLRDHTGIETVICNDADVAGLAEAKLGAGRGFSPIFYITVGSGIGGGLIIDGRIYRGVGQGAAEVGHLRPVYPLMTEPHDCILEEFASGWGIQRNSVNQADTRSIAEAARAGDRNCQLLLDRAVQALAEGICSVIKLLFPRRIIIGGGVSLIGEDLFFGPLREYVNQRGFAAFAGLTEIVPAELGEEVVVHGAIALAKDASESKSQQSQ